MKIHNSQKFNIFGIIESNTLGFVWESIKRDSLAVRDSGRERENAMLDFWASPTNYGIKIMLLNGFAKKIRHSKWFKPFKLL